ncbi:MAG: polyphosphate polymerase domain-containing protein [Verrucomicrobiae bacterium]|nr:polyphosphate polymerase domain-containing protein [Verrucomicrobiae bacterium]
MTTSIPGLRHELKFVATGMGLSEVLTFVKRHPSAFVETYPHRVVNNLYIDSPDCGDYFDHVNGVANRSKTRIRWYGGPVGVIKHPTLERKLKRGAVSGKASHRLPEFNMSVESIKTPIKKAIRDAQLPDLLRLALQCREPSLYNRYRRHYFVSADRRFRLTVDSDLNFAGVQPRFFPLPVTATVIIELKFTPENIEAAALVTNAMPFRITRFSKYVAGLGQL